MHTDIITFESKLQQLNITIYENGNDYIEEIKSEISTTKGPENKQILLKLNGLLTQMEKVNEETIEFIDFLDHLKLELLTISGENISPNKDKHPKSIVWNSITSKENNLPIWLNLTALQHKGDNASATKLFISSDGSSPSKKGVELWNHLITFRTKLVSIIATYRKFDNSYYSINLSKINDYKNMKELDVQLKSMLDKQKNFNKDDFQTIYEIYKKLTKPNYVAINDQRRMHWITSTFRNANIIGAIGNLTNLQNDALLARQMALEHLRFKLVSCGNDSGHIISNVSGPSTARVGEKVNLNIKMVIASFFKNQIVTVSAPNTTVSYLDNGTGVIQYSAEKQGLQKISGTITIRNKSGVPKTEKWEHTIYVLPNSNY